MAPPRALVRYHDLLADWQPVTTAICDDLGLSRRLVRTQV